MQVLVLLPPLEQAPDQMASRPLETCKVIEVPVANEAVPLLPTFTLMPVGVDVTRSPLRPEALTVSVTVWAGGGAVVGGAAAVTVAVAVRLRPPYVAVMVIGVFVPTVVVVTVKPTAVVPEPTVTLAGTLASAGLLLDNDTIAPAGGAPPDNNTNPDVLEPPATLAGLTVTLCKVGPAASGVTVSVALL
ncbi:MAG: hypothetical protein ABWZ42_06830, partial [Ilumatobacteraceae bacterium]